MSDEAKKKVATAAKQAKHAVSNVEDAAELQIEEVVESVVESARPLAPLAQGAVVFVGGAIAYHFVTKTVEKYRQKKADKLEQEIYDRAEPHPMEGVVDPSEPAQ